VTRDTASDGVPRTLIGFVPRGTLPTVTFSRSELLAAQRAALAEIARTNARPGADDAHSTTVCVSAIMRDTKSIPPDSATLRALAVPGKRVVLPRDCPRTYASMAFEADSNGNRIVAPPGWVDPYGLKTTSTGGWVRDQVRVWGEIGQGTGTHGFVCLVQRARELWRAKCETTWSSVS
jgi:hypothetical protein